MPELLHPGVYVLEVPPSVRPIEGASTSTAGFIGVADKGPIPGTLLPSGRAAEPVLVTGFGDFERTFGSFRRDSFLAYAAQAFFDNGGRRLYVVRVAPQDAATASATVGPAAASPPTSPVGAGGMVIQANSQGAWGNNLFIEIVPSSGADQANDAAMHNFGLRVYLNYDAILRLNTRPVESFDQLTYLNSPTASSTATFPADYAPAVVNSRSEFIAIQGDLLAPPAVQVPPIVKLGNGSDGTGTVDYVGSEADPTLSMTGTGIHAFDKISDVSLIAMPGQGDAGIVSAGMEYCKYTRPLADTFFIGDMGSIAGDDVNSARRETGHSSVSSLSEAQAYVNQTALQRSAGDYGAIYYPWLWARDPLGHGRNPQILLPPSGFVAGLYARIDNSRGVFKAPAGTEAGVAGVLSPATIVSDVQQDSLNPNNINVIRPVPGGGVVVWGARTIGSDPGWRYIPVRRMAIFLRLSIYRGIQWAVFEPNDEPLWSSLRLNIRAFMTTQFRAGAFQGATPDDAFFVKCDSSTTTQTDIDNGVVNILVGFAPLKPAEFVVLRLSQKVNQPAQ